MPTGKVKKVVWLSLQSSQAVQNPSGNEVGYGYIDGDQEDQDIYFDYKAVKNHTFEDVQVGQPVEYVRDKSYPITSSVMLVGALLPRRS
jgi:cold shock CspA family protein